MKKQIRKAKIHVGTCLTIDGAQGNEYPYVIITLVRCNGTGKIGFLDDLRRLNVGITRAMKGLIIIGSRRTLLLRDSNNVWIRFFNFCAEKGLLKDSKRSTFKSAATTHKTAKPETAACPPSRYYGITGHSWQHVKMRALAARRAS